MTALVGFEFEFAGPDRHRRRIEATLASATGWPVEWGGSPSPERSVIVLGTDSTAGSANLTGYEIRTPPLPPAEAFDLARRIAAWVRNHPDLAHTHATTGVHVTIDADDPYLLAGLLLLRNFRPVAGETRAEWARTEDWELFVDCVVDGAMNGNIPPRQILTTCVDILDEKYSALHRRREGLWELRWPGGEGWEHQIESVIRQVASILRRSALAARYGLRAVEAAVRAAARRRGVAAFMPTNRRHKVDVERMVDDFRRYADRADVDNVLRIWATSLPSSVRRHDGVLDVLVSRTADLPEHEARYYADTGADLHGRILGAEPALAHRLLDRVLRLDEPDRRLAATMALFGALPSTLLSSIVERLLDAGVPLPAVELTTRLPSVPDRIVERLLPLFAAPTGMDEHRERTALTAILRAAPVDALRRQADTLGRIVERLTRQGRSREAEDLQDFLAERGVFLPLRQPLDWPRLIRHLLLAPEDERSWRRLARALASRADAAKAVLEALPQATAGIEPDVVAHDVMVPLLVAIAGGDPRQTGWRPPGDGTSITPRRILLVPMRPAVPLVRRGLGRLMRTLPEAVPWVIVRFGLRPQDMIDESDVLRLLTHGHLRPEAWARMLREWLHLQGDPVWASPRVIRAALERADLSDPIWQKLRSSALDPGLRVRLQDTLPPRTGSRSGAPGARPVSRGR